MVRVSIDNIKKRYLEKKILDIKHVTIKEGDKIGLIGPNGSGKTTLLNIIDGIVQPDTGSVEVKGSMAYFKQFATGEEIKYNKLSSELRIHDITNIETISGGENTKVRLSSILNEDRDIYLFDEPDANLDVSSRQKLMDKLMEIDTFVLISHDEHILNTCCNVIWNLDQGEIHVYEGNYQTFKELLRHEVLTKKHEYEKYVQEKKKLEEIYEKKVKAAKKIQKNIKTNSDTKARSFGSTGKSFDGKQKSLMKASKNVKKRMDHLEVKEDVKEVDKVKMSLHHINKIVAKNMISVENLSFSYPDKEIFRHCHFYITKGSKVAVVGDNGCGKTTLLNLLIAKNKAFYLAPNVKLGYIMQNFEDLKNDMTVYEAIKEKSIQSDAVNRTILNRMLFDQHDLKKRIAVLSGGEKMRVSIARLLVSDCNVLVLDEPTNYLDTYTVEALEGLLQEYEGNVIFVSHNVNFIDNIATDILFVKDKKIVSYHGKLSEYKEKKSDVQETLLEVRLLYISERMKQASQVSGEMQQEYGEILTSLKKIKGNRL